MADQRRNQLAMIHIGRTQLGMDEDTYRDMLQNQGGVRSSAKLDADGRRKVLDHLRSLGAVFKRRRDPGTVRTGRNALVSKIEAQLADMKLPWSYADAIVEHMHGLTSVRFANPDQLHDVVAALAYEQRRRAR